MYLHKGLQLPSGTWSTAVLLDQALTETPLHRIEGWELPHITALCICVAFPSSLKTRTLSAGKPDVSIC